LKANRDVFMTISLDVNQISDGLDVGLHILTE